MEPKRGKCWKLPIFERKLRGFSVFWVKQKQSACSITLPYSSTFYSLFLPFFVLEIQVFRQTFCFHFQIGMIWTAVWSLAKGYFTQPRLMKGESISRTASPPRPSCNQAATIRLSWLDLAHTYFFIVII